jgi:hypothetical protein
MSQPARVVSRFATRIDVRLALAICVRFAGQFGAAERAAIRRGPCVVDVLTVRITSAARKQRGSSPRG